MSTQQEIIIIILMAIGFCGGAAFGHKLALAGLEDNQVEDYHCAPIVKVSTMEEAKKQIEINQAMTGVKG